MDEIISGSVAGAVGKLFEYPFDTVKVRLQSQSLTNPEYNSAFKCLKQTFNDGFFKMYKGISAPIVAAAAETATLFGAYKYSSELIKPFVENKSVESVLAGSLSGLAASFLLTPIEFVKCNVQVNKESKKANIYKLIKNTLKSGGITYFWRGQLGTAIRECGGSASWFGIYHTFKDDLGPLLAGALAGIGYNLSLYPADSIKSRMQTSNNGSFFKVGREIFLESGLRGFYRGCLITCLRAGPSNAIIFGVHELLTEHRTPSERSE